MSSIPSIPYSAQGEATSSSAKGYGRACIQCRQKKRKCQPSQTDSRVCTLCEREGEVCQVSSKVAMNKPTPPQSRTPSYPQESTKRPRGDTLISYPPQQPPSLRASAILPDQSQDSLNPSWSLPITLPSPRPPSISNLLDSSSPMMQSNQSTPRPMTTGHGTTYTAAIGALVSSVCGSRTEVEPNEQLLSTYFVWQSPQHMPVDEALFRRDMALVPPGPFFSQLLLHSIHAQASRHILSRDDGWVYADRANALLVAGLADPPSLTTIQALLILSGRDLALGLSSASWLKSGMAFRMISELGLEADITEGYHNETHHPEEREMRRRVYWSAYSWDKFYALTLGRQPTLHLPPNHLPPPLIETDVLWQPYYIEVDFDSHYTPQPSYAGDTFYALCLLNVEIESIIQHVYRPARAQRLSSSYDEHSDNLRHRLLQWRHQVKPQILLDTAYLPPICPPPHILTLNTLYRTAWILLLRPNIRHDRLASDDARQTCVEKSTEIHHLFSLHERSFGLRNITYIMAYMAYVSATIDVVEALSTDSTRSSQAVNRLELTLRVLNRAIHHTPGIQRSLHYLRQKLMPTQHSRPITSIQSGAATPTAAHPLEATLSAAQIASKLSDASIRSAVQPEVDASRPSIFGDMPLGAGFDELFASLLPEFSVDANTGFNPFDQGGSTAFLPMGNDDWENFTW